MLHDANIDSLATEGLRFNAQSRMSRRTFLQRTAGSVALAGLGSVTGRKQRDRTLARRDGMR